VEGISRSVGGEGGRNKPAGGKAVSFTQFQDGEMNTRGGREAESKRPFKLGRVMGGPLNLLYMPVRRALAKNSRKPKPLIATF
jgi:hypothetical protein